jgi:putative ABC transport system permease protein
MLALLRSLGLRNLRKHWDRSLLVAASIALGVATLVSSRLLTAAIDDAVRRTSRPLEGMADLFVTNGDAGVRADLADRVRTVPGVREAVPLVIERVLLPDLSERTAVLLGVDAAGRGAQAATAAGVTVTPADPGRFALAVLSGRPAFVGSGLAAELEKAGAAGDRLRLRASQKVHEVRVAGTVTLSGPAAAIGDVLVAMDAAQAAKLLGRPGVVSRIDLFLAAGADPKTVRRAVADALDGAARVETPETHGASSQEVMAGVSVGFTLFGAGALVVGLFLVYNALAVTVAERRREIGILRSLGATRGQVGGLFAAEAMLLGAAGSLAGVPLGWGLAAGGLRLMQTTLREMFPTGDPVTVRLDAATVVIGLAAGLLTALLAALVPAVQAANDEPADAVRRVPSGPARFLLVLQAAASAALVAGGLGMVLARSHLPPRTGTYGGLALALVGLLLAAPLATAVIAWLLRPVARRLLPLEARLAADNLARAPGRCGLVIGALAAGVALVLQVAGLGRTLHGPIMNWLGSAVQADLVVTCGGPERGGAYLPFESDAGAELARTPGVARVIPIRHRVVDYGHTAVLAVALDTAAYLETARARRPFAGLEAYDRLREPGTALVAENFAALHRVRAGDTIRLPGPAGPVPLRVVGTVEDYRWNRGAVIVDRDATYTAAFADPLVDAYSVILPPGTDDAGVAAVRGELQRRGAAQALWVIDRRELDGYVRQVLEQPFVLAYVQQVVLGAVAALGMVTALLIAVLQRRRELGLLRAVGATRTQVLWSVIAEASLLGVVGTLLGCVVAVPMEWFVVRVVIFEESGFLFPLALPWREALGVAAVAVGLSALAGLGPAWRAVSVPVTEAIAYE